MGIIFWQQNRRSRRLLCGDRRLRVDTGLSRPMLNFEPGNLLCWLDRLNLRSKADGPGLDPWLCQLRHVSCQVRVGCSLSSQRMILWHSRIGILRGTPSSATSSHLQHHQKMILGWKRTVSIILDRGTKRSSPPSMRAELQLIVEWDGSWYAIPNPLASNMRKAGLTVLRAPLREASSVYVPIKHDGIKQQTITTKEQLLAMIEQYGSKVSACASAKATRLATDGKDNGPRPDESLMRDNACELRAMIENAIKTLPIK